MSDNKNLSEEEYLRKHLEDLEASKSNSTNTGGSAPSPKVTVDNSRVTELQYFSFDIKDFPCAIFYPAGTLVKVRAAQVKEIQAYSMVDDNNFYDIVEKMNDMLSACVRVQYGDGAIGSFLDLRDPDRYYLIFLIRELTFQQGTNLITKTACKCGNEEVSIELNRENFRYFEPHEKINKYYNPSLRCFTFETKNGKVFNLAPPTIGLQKSFTDYIIKENSEKKKPNLSFLKIIPFLLHDRTSITIDGIKSKLDEFQKMDDISFQFLNSAVEKMSFGIKELVKNCPSCGLEVHSDMIFPDGPSAIFVIHDAFDQFIKE